MRLQQSALLLAVLVHTATACKKDTDTSAPSVRILAPAAGTTITVPDTFTVRVQVSDDQQVRALTIEVVDAVGTSVASGGTIAVNSTSGVFEQDIAMVSERLLTGPYTVVARASDGANDARAFQDVQISGVPLRLRSIFLAPPFSEQSTTITRIDSTGSQSAWATTADFNGIAVDSYWQHLFVAGSRIAPLQAQPTAPWALPWQVAPPASDRSGQFTALTVDPSDKRVYFATRDGVLRGFTGDGVQHFTAHCLPDHRCEAFVTTSQHVVTWQRAVVGGTQRVVAYSPAGTVMEAALVQPERVGAFRRSGNELLLFSNTGAHSSVGILDIRTGGVQELYTFNEGTMRACVQLDGGNYALAIADRILRYNANTNSVTPLNQGLFVDALAYDPANGALYAAEGNTLHTLDASSGAILNSLTTGTAIAHILPLLNR